MNEYSNSTAAWSTKKSSPHHARPPKRCRPASNSRSEDQLSNSENSRRLQKFTSKMMNAEEPLVAPASCRRFSAPPPRLKFPRLHSISTRYNYLLEIAVTPTKQISRPISTRYKIGNRQSAISTDQALPTSRRKSNPRPQPQLQNASPSSPATALAKKLSPKP